MDDGDPHDEIERLEARIEDLTARIENCRKFILAGRSALAGGGIALAATVLGAIPFDPAVITTAVAAVLGGIVVWGSNHSTVQETVKDLAAAQAQWTALIGRIDLRVVPADATLQ